MWNRTTALVLAGILTVGSLAGCSSSKKSSSDTTTAGSGGSATTAASTGGGGGGASDKVKAFCDSVDAYVAKVKAAINDPSKLSGLTSEGTDLASKSAALATGLTPAESQQVSACAQKAAKALTPGG